MNRETFMKELEYLLQDISDDEKADALSYYADYLEEAGLENEEKVLQEFGSPERIAAIIRADLKGDLESGGGFTERGYEDDRFRQPNYQLAHREQEEHSFYSRTACDETPLGETGQSAEAGEPSKEKPEKNSRQVLKMVGLAAAVMIGILLLPVVFGLGLGAVGIVFSLLFGAAALLAVFVFTAAIWTVAWLIAGVFILIAGIAVMATPLNFLNGIWCIGLGIAFLGIGLLSLSVSILFYGKFLPWLVKLTTDAISRLFRKKGKTA